MQPGIYSGIFAQVHQIFLGIAYDLSQAVRGPLARAFLRSEGVSVYTNGAAIPSEIIQT